MKKLVALVKGDGSAPEMMAAACAVVSAAAKRDGLEVAFEHTPMGWNIYDECGDTLPAESLRRAVEIGTVFFGGVGDTTLDNTIGVKRPEMKPEARCLLALRQKMGLLLNFRPAIYHYGLRHLARVRPETIPEEGIIQIWVRFLLQDMYFGNADLMEYISQDVRRAIGIKLKHQVTGDEQIVTDLGYYRRETLEKYFRAAFSYARKGQLPVISVDKANIMARYDFWRKIVTRIWKTEFPDVPLQHQLVDSANALLFTPAALRGVIVCGNEQGDILSDGALAAVGSMGLMHSSAINPDTGAAMFESGAGTAPTLAGQDKANPIGRILAGAMMLRHFDAVKSAEDIEQAVQAVLAQGYRTADLLGGDQVKEVLSTTGMTGMILHNLRG